MPRTTLLGVLRIIGLWAVSAALLTGLLCLAPLLDNGFGRGFWPDLGAFCTVAAFGGVLGAAVVYLIFAAKSLRGLRLRPEEMSPAEVVAKMTRGSMVYYPGGRASRFWEAVGGKLILNSSQLVFKVHWGQPRVAGVVLPLAEVADAWPCRLLGLSPNGLMVERTDGRRELFGCGLESARDWAAAIMVFRGMGPVMEGRKGV
jgi:hypothetical protein